MKFIFKVLKIFVKLIIKPLWKLGFFDEAIMDAISNLFEDYSMEF